MQLTVDSGQLPVGWKVKKLGDVCKFQGGSQPPKSTFSTICKENYVRLIQIRDYKSDNHVVFIPKDKARRFCAKEDVMIGRYGPPVFQILRGLEGAYNVALMKATPDESQLLKNFLFYFLKTPKIQTYVINLSARAAGQSGLNKETIEPYLIPIPPIPEQKRIVAILDEAFEGIDRAIANTEKNLANSRELFESYLNAIFTQKGDGWVEKKLGDVCTFQGGSQPPKAVFSTEKKEGYIRLIQIRDYKSDNYTVYIPKKDARRFCQPDDVMIGRYGPPLFQILRGLEGAYNVALMKAIPNEEIISKNFLFYFLQNRKIFNYIINSSSRTAGQTGLNKATIEPYPIVFPTLEQQAFIVSQLQEIKAETQRFETIYRQKLAALNELKQSILQKAFTGELTANTLKSAKEEIAA